MIRVKRSKKKKMKKELFEILTDYSGRGTKPRWIEFVKISVNRVMFPTVNSFPVISQWEENEGLAFFLFPSFFFSA